MSKISKHFNRYEIACKCGCGLDTIDAKTMMIADEARDYVCHPITPSSGCRCAEHNMNVGGVSNSQHVLLRAIDLPVDNPKKLYDYLNEKYPNQYGLGLYNTFVHVDTKGGNARRWDIRT